MNAMKLLGCLTIIFCVITLCGTCLALGPNTSTVPVNVGVIVDGDTWIGNLGLSCIHMALSDFYASHTHYKTRILLNITYSNTLVISAASAAVDLIKDAGVEAIIGPQYSRQANVVIDVGNKAQVPILSFSATSPSLQNPPNPYFFRVAQSDVAQVAAIAAIVEAFEWTQVVPIYEEGLYAGEVIPSLIKAFQEANVQVPHQIAISPTSTDQQIIQELNNLRMMSNRVFIVHMPPVLGSRVFTKARDIGMMTQGYVWIMTTSMTNPFDWTKSSLTDSMQGVLGVATYFPRSQEQQDFEARWKLQFQRQNPSIMGGGMNVLGLWAYDAATALAIAVEISGISNMSSPRTSGSTNATGIDILGVGVSQSGPMLREALAKTTFKGLAGEFSCVNGEINSTSFQIINVIGDGKNVVGFWTPQKGLERKLGSYRDVNKYSASKASLGPIIWPGDSSTAPKGWDVAPNGKIRVGGPFISKNGFTQLVETNYDSDTKTTTISGYCIDVFKAAVEALPYIVPYEFITIDRPNIVFEYDNLHNYYDYLIQQAYHGEIDAVVGDTTISFERSQYVDFTLPFTDSGATFIVPTEEKNKTKAWIFLKPLTWQLWLTSGCFFVFIAFVVWVLEHRINEEFRGSPSHQLGTSFWFSFSTMVFAQREKIHSNLARVVVIIWVFVVLILTQSYTASFTTLLTVQQLRPTVTDVNQLIQSGDSVGYQIGSYAFDILKQMGFDETRLQPYHSPQECDQLLTIGSRNGGIAAAFDETPYFKVMQARYCSKYTTMGPTYKSPGFGFAFRKNSPLAGDVSRAILNLTQNNPDIMRAIENKWFKNETHCVQAASDEDASYSLDLDSFRGLFLLAGVASSSALIIHVFLFVIGNRQHLRSFDSQDSIWKRIWIMFKVFYQKDPTLYSSQNNTHQISQTTIKIGDHINEAQLPSPRAHFNQICPDQVPRG